MEEFLKELGCNGGGGEEAHGLGAGGLARLAGRKGADGEGLEKLLEGMPGLEGLSKEEIMGHASKLWNHMDELAEDPKAYREFLERQAEAAGVPPPDSSGPLAGARPPPSSASLVVNTRFQRAPKSRPPLAPGGPVVLSLTSPGPMVHAVVAVWRPGKGPAQSGLAPACRRGGAKLDPSSKPPADWRRVDVPCRMRIDPFEQRTEQGKSAVIYEVVCHEDTVDLACSDTRLAETFRLVLVEKIFRWLEEKHDVALSRTGRQMRILVKDAEVDLARTGGPEGVPTGLLDQLSGLAMPSKVQAGADAQPGKAKQEAGPKRPLVQELETPAAPVKRPLAFTVSDGDGDVFVTIEVPSGLKGSDFDINVTGTQLHIAETENSARTVVELPETADPDKVRAKFEKKLQRLTVTVGLAA